jgi:hypothetical protein
MGLPYVSDPGITRHLAGFLHAQSAGAARPPDALLFNGGVFQPAVLRERVVDVMRKWYGGDWQPLVLTNPSLDLAVAWGAAYYGWLRQTGGRRIGGGIARSYYIAVNADAPADARSALNVLCVVPQHLEEEREVALAKPELELSLGQPVAFPLYSSTVRGEDRPGEVLRLRPDQLRQLPPLHTVLRGGKRSGTKRVPVTLAVRSTAIGTLEIYCQAKDGNNRWRLEFNVRDVLPEPSETPLGDESRAERPPTVRDVWPEHQVLAAAERIHATYTGSEAPAELTRALESVLEASRQDWPTGLCRRLWEFLAGVAEQRLRSPAHQARWLNLVGYCLRPGFGDPMDRFRIDQLWKLLAGPGRAASSTPRVAESGADLWILWRRVAGGLNATLQQALFDRLRPVLLTGKGKAGFRPGANELAEMWRAAASFERLPTSAKETLAEQLLRSLRRSPAPTYGFWSLTRLGARRLVYGPLNAVVHPQRVEAWLDAILGFEPANQSEHLAWAFCLAQLARKTGQRALDVDDSHQRSVLAVLRGLSIPGHWIHMVEEVTESEQEEQGQLLGDSLPIGLRLVPSTE